MRSISCLLVGALVFVGCVAASAQDADAVLTEKSAFLALPPQYVAGPQVRQALWSSDGRFLLVSVADMRLTARELRKALLGGPAAPRVDGGQRLLVWTAADGTIQVVWKDAGSDVGVEAHWLPGSAVALVVLRNAGWSAGLVQPGAPRQYRDLLLRVDAVTGATRTLVRSDPEESLTVSASPSRPMATVVRRATVLRTVAGPDGKERPTAEVRERVVVVRADGGIGASAALPPDLQIIDEAWTGPDRVALRCLPVRRSAQQPLFLLDARTGALQPLEKWPAPPQTPADERAVKVVRDGARLVAGATSRAVHPVWLAAAAAGKEPPALIAADATWASLSPNGDAVAYEAGGSLFVCPLMEISRAEFEAARDAARRTMLLSNGKQCALAALMYAQDHDLNLPTAGEDIAGLLGPYLKNLAPLEGFVYTFAGGPLSGVQAPAETQMGYLAGPGGRAVVYLDGHVKWRDDR